MLISRFERRISALWPVLGAAVIPRAARCSVRGQDGASCGCKPRYSGLIGARRRILPQGEPESLSLAGLLSGADDDLARKDGGHTLLLSLFRAGSRGLWRYAVAGLEHLPDDGPFIICANHLSHLDVFWVACALPATTRARLSAFGKKEHAERRFTRWAASLVNTIYVDREGDFLPAMRRGAARLRQGGILFLHPEGTRSVDGRLLPFKPGAAILATVAGVPLVPAAIGGAYDVFPKHRALPSLLDWSARRRHSVRVVFGEPIAPAPGGERRQIRELTALLRERVAALLAALPPG